MGAPEIIQELLTEHTGVTLLTPIYQSDASSLGDGVCRAIAAQWLAMLSSAAETGVPGLVTELRRKMANLQEYGSQFVAIMGDHEFHFAPITALTPTMQAAEDELENARLERLAAINALMADMGNTELQEALEEARMKYDAKLAVRDLVLSQLAQLFASYLKVMSGGTMDMTKQAGHATVADLVANVGALAPGYHYVGLGNHAVALYIDPIRSLYMFIDANTGEFMANDQAELAAFVQAHMAAVYEGQYDQNPVSHYSSGLTITPHDADLTVAPPPPAPADSSGIFGMISSIFSALSGQQGTLSTGRTHPALAGSVGIDGGLAALKSARRHHSRHH